MKISHNYISLFYIQAILFLSFCVKIQSKRFGEGFSHKKVEEVNGTISIKSFILSYFLKQKPLLIKGGVHASPAFTKWSDEYFLSLDVDPDNRVLAETQKKEDREQETKLLHFSEFVRSYNNSDLYMVESVPDFLKQDVYLPCFLQCSKFMMTNCVMWFSSGGTKSVVHTDSMNNLNCVYRGYKHFILVDKKYSHKVDLDHPEGSYSSVDVDSVDYKKYPGLAEVEYYNATVMSGDCLYIPYLWVHQVRSYESNIAINLWWDHYTAFTSDLSECFTVECIANQNIQNISFHSDIIDSGIIKDRIMSTVGVTSQVTLDDFKKRFLQVPDDVPYADRGKEILSDIFHSLDFNEDGILTKSEVLQTFSQQQDKIFKSMQEIKALLEGPDDEQSEASGDSDPILTDVPSTHSEL